MTHRLTVSVLCLTGGSLLAQFSPPDSLLLEEVPVVDYRVEANSTFVEEVFDLDSLITGRATLAEALQRSSAFFVRTYGGSGVATLSIRGTSASHSKVYWNNLEIGSPMLGTTDLSAIPMQSVDELQVQYGFASLSDGTGGLGGSLRLTSALASSNEAPVELSLYAGSFGRWQGSGKMQIGNERMGLQAGVMHFRAKNDFSYPNITQPGYPQERLAHSGFEQEAWWSNLHLRTAANGLLTLKSLYSFTRRELPPPLTGNQARFDRLKDRRLLNVIEYQQQGEKSNWLLSSGLVLDQNYFDPGADTQSYNNEFLSWQSSARVQREISQGLHMESGGRFRIESARSEAYSGAQQQLRSSIFSDWRWDIAKWLQASLLLREELVDKQLSPLLGAVGLHSVLQQYHHLRINLARNYRFPTLNDLNWQPGGNPDLQPERSLNLEAGYSWERAKWPMFSITLFRNVIDNWIMWQPAGNLWQPVNLRKVLNQGIEVKVSQGIRSGNYRVNWMVNYAYTRSRSLWYYDGTEADPDHQLPYVPEHMLNLGADLHYKQYMLRIQQSYTGKYFTNASNSVYMPGYPLLNLTFGMANVLDSKKHDLSVNLELNNVFNYAYQVLPYRPEPGFNAGIRLQYRFLK